MTDTEMVQAKALKGGEWLLKESDAADIFIAEELSEEQLLIQDTFHQFLKAEVLPMVERIDNQEPGLMERVMAKAGEQGMLALSISEEYGGLGKDFITSIAVNEAIGAGFSFAVAYAAHTGIGSLPILYFGTEEQKQKYLPNLASGQSFGAYGLTEPNSGSDALGARTTARLSDDGKYYILNGQKCWITNGGFADIFTVFAKIDGDKFSAFIVERGFEGFSNGPEEHKLGIKGSSTVQLYFQDCKVPVENLLGEIGRGHIIAFNILNIGRLKLAAECGGTSQYINTIAVQYAKAREQFNISISRFGAIKHKLAEMAIQSWVNQSGMYRVSKWIDEKEKEGSSDGTPSTQALLKAAEEYAIECAILKVFGSEMIDFCVDECLQIHGGNGFSADYAISRAYQDSRINRIFEGTNEINRLLIVDMTLKRAMKGKLDLMTAATNASKELMSLPDFSNDDEMPFAKEKKYISNFKKAILLVAGAAVQKLMIKLDKEQEMLMNIADMVIQTYMAESGLLRTIKLSEIRGEEGASMQMDITRTFLYDAADRISKAGKDAINSFAEGDELRMMHIGLKRFTKVEPFNTKEARRRIANQMIEVDGYEF